MRRWNSWHVSAGPGSKAFLFTLVHESTELDQHDWLRSGHADRPWMPEV